MAPASYNFDEDEYGADEEDSERVPLASQNEKGHNHNRRGPKFDRDDNNEKPTRPSAMAWEEEEDIEEVDGNEDQGRANEIASTGGPEKSSRANKQSDDDKSLDTEDEPLTEIAKRTAGSRSPSNSNSNISSAQSSSKFTNSSSTLHSSQQSLTSGFTPSVFGALCDLQERNADRTRTEVVTSLPLLGLDDSQQNPNDSIRWEDEASHITERTEESESLSKIIEESSDAGSSHVHRTSDNVITTSTANINGVSVCSSALDINIPTTDDDLLLAGARMDQSSRKLIHQKNTIAARTVSSTSNKRLRSGSCPPPSPQDDLLLNGARMDQSFKSLTYDLKNQQPMAQQQHRSLKQVDEEYGLGNQSQDLASQVTSVARNTSVSQLHAKHREALRKQQGSGGCCGDVIQSKWDVVALVSFGLSAILLIVVVIVFELVV